ncbi:hypothetical protein, partial [Frankia sp. Cppng1_Ct_nod]|uniref:hypothetical protein n=1 Tax=Frankia sp. Cppng1_Ct_nod TaxID=2897162 RepID=UPI0020259F93
YVLTPPRDVGGDWPTLGSMVERNRRLVVFAESADVPGDHFTILEDHSDTTAATVRKWIEALI